MKDCSECPYVQALHDKSQEMHRVVQLVGLLLSDRIATGDVRMAVDSVPTGSWEALKTGLQLSPPRSETIDPRLLTGEFPELSSMYNDCQQLITTNDALCDLAIHHAQVTCYKPEPDEFLQSMGVEVLHCTSQEKVGVWDV